MKILNPRYDGIELIPTKTIKSRCSKLCINTLNNILSLMYNEWVPTNAPKISIPYRIKLGSIRGKNNIKNFEAIYYGGSNKHIQINPKISELKLVEYIIHEFRHWFQETYFKISFTDDQIVSKLSNERYLNLPEEVDANRLEDISPVIIDLYQTIKASKKVFSNYKSFKP